MNPTAVAPAMTTDELLALPWDGLDGGLIRGRLRQRSWPVGERPRRRVQTTLGWLLGAWSEQHPRPLGEIVWDSVWLRLRRDPDTTVCPLLAFFAAPFLPELTGPSLIDGVPAFAVEVLEPKDTQEEIHERIDAFRDTGRTQVWAVDPHDRTVLVYRPGAEPELFNVRQDLSGDPHLPGFRVPVAQIFKLTPPTAFGE